MKSTRDILAQLIACPSITPNDEGCQNIIRNMLKQHGFTIEDMSTHGTTNTWAFTGSENEVKFVFAGHTDVVPVTESEWATDPFSLTQIDNNLIGRGVADMKGAIASFLSALQSISNPSDLHLGIILTSDEEGDATYGTQYVTQQLVKRGIQPQSILIGEPSSLQQLGDSIRIGRRGSIHFNGIIHGQSGHSAYPEQITNPIDLLPRVYNHYQNILAAHQPSDHGLYPPTHLAFTSFSADKIASNVTPEQASFSWNLRYSPFFRFDAFQSAINDLHNTFNITGSWSSPSVPYDGKSGQLAKCLSAAIEQQLNVQPSLNAGGGTSDGRFLQAFGCEVIEFGHINKTIHQSNEAVPMLDVDRLTKIYHTAICQMALQECSLR